MKHLFIGIFTMTLLNFSVYAKKPDWFLKLQEIKVFQSNRQDVERVFDNPKFLYSSNENPKETGWGETVEYQTTDGKLEVFYSTGRCSEQTNKKGWDIDKDLVVSIEFEPNEPIKLSDLELDLSSFSGYKESDNQYFQYKSEKLGVEFTLLGGEVTYIEYSITPEMKKLDCEIILKNK